MSWFYVFACCKQTILHVVTRAFMKNERCTRNRYSFYKEKWTHCMDQPPRYTGCLKKWSKTQRCSNFTTEECGFRACYFYPYIFLVWYNYTKFVWYEINVILTCSNPTKTACYFFSKIMLYVKNNVQGLTVQPTGRPEKLFWTFFF